MYNNLGIKKTIILLVISTIFFISALLHILDYIDIDSIATALFFIAALPWIMPYLQRSLKSVEILGNKIEFLETEIHKQQRIINDLVIFSLSSSLFNILSHIHYKREYKYHSNEGMQRSLRFLRDHGYVHYFRFDQLRDNEDIVGILQLTPAGELLLQERERREGRGNA